MLSLGVDFGSTYSSVASYREDIRAVEPMLAGMAVPHIPSVAAVKNDQMDFGRAAKTRAGKSGVMTFKGFKMLLTEDDAYAASRGYTGIYTPEYVTERYLEHILAKAVEYYHRGREVDRLVVGIPEIWFQNVRSVDARARLREICRKYLFVRQVQIVSEPSAACAFFAYNYFRNSREGALYDGQILLVDYGGGTLDITLTEVKPCADGAQPGLMEIRVLEQVGAGENADGEIGQAGIAYMESLMEASLRRFGIGEPGPGLRGDPRFVRAVDRLEEDLQSMTDAIRDVYSAFGTETPSDIPDALDEFTTIEYAGMDVPIRYSVMLEVYRQKIYPVLDRKLEEIIRYMEARKIPFMERNRENFKIALVGGFGNFFLVSDQVEKKFAFSTTDLRQRGIIFNRGDRENAIAMGAALLAEGVVGIRNTAPCSLGLASLEVSAGEEAGEADMAAGARDGRFRHDYAIRYREPIHFEEPCFALDGEGHPILYYLGAGGIRQLAYNPGKEEGDARIRPIRPAYRELIRKAAAGTEDSLVAVGFSLDAAGVASVHIQAHDWLGRHMDGQDRIIELTRLDDLLEP